MAEFNETDKIRRLLWCDRHCCLCGKSCDIDIEFAHLPSKEGSDNIDDGIPVCSYCHIKMNAYDPNHRKGTKYKIEELITRREQIYEKYTSHLVPPINFQITQNLSNGKVIFPKVGFCINHCGNSLPVKVLVKVETYLSNKLVKSHGGHYGGEESWNMNPSMGYQAGSLDVSEAVNSTEGLEIKVFIKVIDSYERTHELLPVAWHYERNDDYWFADP